MPQKHSYYNQSVGSYKYDYPDPALVARIKEDVIGEINAEQEAREANREFKETRMSYSNSNRQLSAHERQMIKRDVLRQLNDDIYEMGYNSYMPYAQNKVDRIVIENIKNELLAELATAQYAPGVQSDGWRTVLSDRNIDRRINQQYGNLRSLRKDIRRGLQSAQSTEQRLNRIADPQVRQAVHTIVQEARQEGIPLEQVINSLDANSQYRAGFGQRVGGWLGSGAGRGFLGGIGISLAIALLLPSTRGGLRNIGIKMMENSMDLADQTQTVFGRAKEGFEDMIAEANFNNLQKDESFSDFIEPTTPENPIDDNPTH